MSTAAGPPEGRFVPRGLCLTALLAAPLALAGCPPGGGPDRFPIPRLTRETEKAVKALVDEMRGRDYLARVKAVQELERRIKGDAPGGPAVVSYLVPLLDEPRWDVRAAAFRLLMRYGRFCPEAVAALVQALGDMNVNAAVRDGAARALTSWTGKSFGYNAWAAREDVEARASRWSEWLEETGGRIPLPEPAAP